jgi:hypothetical protein
MALVAAGVLLAGVADLLSATSSREAPAAAESPGMTAEPTPIPATPNPTAEPTPMLAVEPPANRPPAGVSNPEPPPQAKPAPAIKVQKNDDKEDKKDEKKEEKKPGNGGRGRD